MPADIHISLYGLRGQVVVTRIVRTESFKAQATSKVQHRWLCEKLSAMGLIHCQISENVNALPLDSRNLAEVPQDIVFDLVLGDVYFTLHWKTVEGIGQRCTVDPAHPVNHTNMIQTCGHERRYLTDGQDRGVKVAARVFGRHSLLMQSLLSDSSH